MNAFITLHAPRFLGNTKDFFMGIKNILIRIDDFREEILEDFLADKILAPLDKNATADKLEKAAIKAAILAANAYVSTYGVSVPESVADEIAASSVKFLDLANEKLQKMLKKKSKKYLKRHTEQEK